MLPTILHTNLISFLKQKIIWKLLVKIIKSQTLVLVVDLAAPTNGDGLQ